MYVWLFRLIKERNKRKNRIKKFDRKYTDYRTNQLITNTKIITKLDEIYGNKKIEELKQELLGIKINIKEVSSNITMYTTGLLPITILIVTIYLAIFSEIVVDTVDTLLRKLFFFFFAIVLFLIIYIMRALKKQFDLKNHYELIEEIIENKIKELENIKKYEE